MKNTIRKKWIITTVVFTAVLLLITAVFLLPGTKQPAEDTAAERIVAVNEVQQLIRRGEDEQAALKLQALKEKMQAGQINEAAPSKKGTAVYSCIVFLFLFAVMGYLYYRILRPFEKLQGFAKNIAQGNFDVPLKYERCNYFGAFTWAFDSMRKEIIKARAAEREAVENNKTVIATLSHDIKTPVASIRAYAEGLAAHMDTTPEKRMKFA